MYQGDKMCPLSPDNERKRVLLSIGRSSGSIVRISCVWDVMRDHQRVSRDVTRALAYTVSVSVIVCANAQAQARGNRAHMSGRAQRTFPDIEGVRKRALERAYPCARQSHGTYDVVPV